MKPLKPRLFCWFFAMLLALTGCVPLPQGEPKSRPETLTVKLLYPNETSDVEMGQSIKGIIQVFDSKNQIVKDASVMAVFIDPTGREIGNVPANFGSGDVYRTDAWLIPHHMQEGAWTVEVDAQTELGRGKMIGDLRVRYSTSEILYHKYGFWLDAPRLRDINPFLVAEQGDANDGLIRWGGQIPTQHVFVENWVEVHWRKGNYDLKSTEDVRRLLLETIGNIGFTPIREIGTFERTRFKRWDAWTAPARGQLSYYEMKWTIFYAPEVDKTFAILTTVVLPPPGVDANAVLLNGFDIDPSIDAQGVAPQPIQDLLSAPDLIGPPLGARYFGTADPIILEWAPLKSLAPDEYYRVSVDYNYDETNNAVEFTTRDTHLTLPVSLYRTPNCTVFNWRVTLMQQTGANKNGKPISYDSLYWYVQWLYPPGEKASFALLCPNAQY